MKEKTQPYLCSDVSVDLCNCNIAGYQKFSWSKVVMDWKTSVSTYFVFCRVLFHTLNVINNFFGTNDFL
jgi:hypothetical protein